MEPKEATSSSESCPSWLHWRGSIFRRIIWSSLCSLSSFPKIGGSCWLDVEKVDWPSSLSHSPQASKLWSNNKSKNYKTKVSQPPPSNHQCSTTILHRKSLKEDKAHLKERIKLVTQDLCKSRKYLKLLPATTCKTPASSQAMRLAREQSIQTAIRNWAARRTRAQCSNLFRFQTIWIQAVAPILRFRSLEEIWIHLSIDRISRTWTSPSGKALSGRSWEARSMRSRRRRSKSMTTTTTEACKLERRAWRFWDRQTRSHQMAPTGRAITLRRKHRMLANKRSKACQRQLLASLESTPHSRAPRDRTQPESNELKKMPRTPTSSSAPTWAKSAVSILLLRATAQPAKPWTTPKSSAWPHTRPTPRLWKPNTPWTPTKKDNIWSPRTRAQPTLAPQCWPCRLHSKESSRPWRTSAQRTKRQKINQWNEKISQPWKHYEHKKLISKHEKIFYKLK